MSAASAAALGATVLALATLLATVVARMLPYGLARRIAEEYGIVLGCASPALALLGPYAAEGRAWAPAAILASGYGGAYLIRVRQLRRADRDGVRRLLGLHRDASYGELLHELEGVEPAPTLTIAGRLVLCAGAAVLLVLGAAVGRFDAALVALALGVAEGSVRPAYRRQLARRVREIGH